MSAESAAMMRTWRVGKRRVTMTAPQVRIGQVGMATMEWHPDMPSKLSRRERKQYGHIRPWVEARLPEVRDKVL